MPVQPGDSSLTNGSAENNALSIDDGVSESKPSEDNKDNSESESSLNTINVTNNAIINSEINGQEEDDNKSETDGEEEDESDGETSSLDGEDVDDEEESDETEEEQEVNDQDIDEDNSSSHSYIDLSDSDTEIESDDDMSATSHPSLASSESSSVPVCYICLNAFDGQDVGCPDVCDTQMHYFCLECIEEWAKVSVRMRVRINGCI